MPARPADQDALDLGDPPGGQEALLVADGDDLVVQLRLPRRREEVLADALDEVRPAGAAREHRALRVGGDDADVGVLRLEVAGRAGDRAARAGTGDEVGDPPGRLRPQLGPGRLLVGQRVVRVGVLVGPEGVAAPRSGARRPSSSSAGRRGRRRPGTRRPRRRRPAAARSSPVPPCRSSRTRSGSRAGRRRWPARRRCCRSSARRSCRPAGAGRRARRRASSPAPGGPSTSRRGWSSPSSWPARSGSRSTSLIRLIRTSGVLPIRSSTESAIAVPARRSSPMPGAYPRPVAGTGPSRRSGAGGGRPADERDGRAGQQRGEEHDDRAQRHRRPGGRASGGS